MPSRRRAHATALRPATHLSVPQSSSLNRRSSCHRPLDFFLADRQSALALWRGACALSGLASGTRRLAACCRVHARVHQDRTLKAEIARTHELQRAKRTLAGHGHMASGSWARAQGHHDRSTRLLPSLSRLQGSRLAGSRSPVARALCPAPHACTPTPSLQNPDSVVSFPLFLSHQTSLPLTPSDVQLSPSFESHSRY